MNNRNGPAGLLLLAFMVSAPVFAAASTPEATTCPSDARLRQASWATIDGKTQALFKSDEVVLRKKGTLSVAKILKREPCRLFVRYGGLRSTWSVASGAADTLELKADEPMTLRALATSPPELDINLPTLPKPGPISAAEAKSVEEELLRRVGKDQEVLKNPAMKDKRAEVVADNHRYLQELTQKFGWIDVPRFGKSSASAAILLAKHSSDLLLMKAALPIVEEDVKKHGGAGEMFSVLYDELQIELGNQQRYGTQMDTDKQGHLYILPLEDPAKVDVYRKEIGILSFEEYLKLASDTLYKGTQIRVAGSDE